jgi:signal transduction histidine kinase
MPGLTFHFHRPNYLASYTFIPGLRQGIKEMTFGVGITGMRERLWQVGGRLEIESSERGATVRAIVPMQCEAS